jgi:penicillin amidase
MRILTTILSALALTGALYVGARPVGPVPPLGPFLDPAQGIWAAARVADLPRTQELALAGLRAPVEIVYDDRGVPHIFGASEPDVARALGWVHARDRLFQMELIQRAVAGTLTELVGARALPLDRNARRLAFAQAAQTKWAAVPAGSAVRAAVDAYMEGVNAYIAQMRPEDLPLEYRLLNRQPRRFEPVDTYYLLIRMSETLSYQEGELRFHALEQLVGREAASALIPVDAPIQEPIEPVAGRQRPRLAFRPLPAPRAPDAQHVAAARRVRDAAVAIAAARALPLDGGAAAQRDLTELLTRGEAAVGSNNWAVAPARSASGHALLAGDPHLELTLPSIWYEAHLVVPGQMDVYGVSFPLSPIIPIGFNREMAWTMTNTGNDVVDYYRETVDDSASPRRYLLDGTWQDITRRTEVFRDGRGRVIAEDTMFATHRGPLLSTSIGWLSQRWTAREVSDEGENFRSGMTATGVRDFYARMESFRTPAQNMLTADRQGNIGIRSTGRYPIRPGDGRGDLIRDGSTRANDWTGDRPVSWYPQALNPAQGYLASANQQPIDPAVRAGYHGSDWPSPWRAMRINALLRANPSVTVEDMRRFHTDPRSELTPFLFTALGDARVAAESGGTWTADDEAAWGHLQKWDATFTPNSAGAVLFDALYQTLVRLAWDELILPGEDRRVMTPSQMTLVQLLQDPRSVWWDDRRTPDAIETRDAIVLRALREAWTSTRTRWGNDPAAWRWGAARVIRVHHLLRLPGFGRDSLEVQSGPGTLSPSDNGGTHGASWRFVVELGPEVRGWGTYPGGQSGNPVAARYADRIATWQAGELTELRVPRAPADLSAERTMATLRLTPTGGND